MSNKQVSLHGRRAYVTKDDELVGRGGVAAGGEGRPFIGIPGAPDMVAVFDDFVAQNVDGVGDTGFIAGHNNSTFFTLRGADTGNEAKFQNATNGVLSLGPVTDGTQTADGTRLALTGRAANWRPDQGAGTAGRLRMVARIKQPTWNAAGVFVGFADTGVLGTGEMPFYDTGDGQPTDTGQLHTGTVAADMMGFYFGENADTGIRGVSAKSTPGDSGDQEVLLTSSAPTANKYQEWELEYVRGLSDTGGAVNFYIDGVRKGRIVSPIASNALLTPIVAIITSDTGAPQLDVDYIGVSAPRDTGT